MTRGHMRETMTAKSLAGSSALRSMENPLVKLYRVALTTPTFSRQIQVRILVMQTTAIA